MLRQHVCDTSKLWEPTRESHHDIQSSTNERRFWPSYVVVSYSKYREWCRYSRRSSGWTLECDPNMYHRIYGCYLIVLGLSSNPGFANPREASPEASRSTVQLHTPMQTEICQPSRELRLKENFDTVPSINLYGDRRNVFLTALSNDEISPSLSWIISGPRIQSGQSDTGRTLHILMRYMRYASCSGGTWSFDSKCASLRCPFANAIENGV